jgi:hypothetical protein
MRLVLPEDAVQQRPEPVDAQHPAPAGRPDYVRGRHLQPAERLGGEQQLHQPGLQWYIGGIFLIALAAALAGLLGFIYMRVTAPAFFRKQTLTRATPTLMPEQ